MDHLRNWCGKSALRCIAALRSPSAAGIALWILSMTGAALLIFAFHEILGRVNVK